MENSLSCREVIIRYGDLAAWLTSTESFKPIVYYIRVQLIFMKWGKKEKPFFFRETLVSCRQMKKVLDFIRKVQSGKVSKGLQCAIKTGKWFLEFVVCKWHWCGIGCRNGNFAFYHRHFNDKQSQQNSNFNIIQWYLLVVYCDILSKLQDSHFTKFN